MMSISRWWYFVNTARYGHWMLSWYMILPFILHELPQCVLPLRRRFAIWYILASEWPHTLIATPSHALTFNLINGIYISATSRNITAFLLTAMILYDKSKRISCHFSARIFHDYSCFGTSIINWYLQADITFLAPRIHSPHALLMKK